MAMIRMGIMNKKKGETKEFNVKGDVQVDH